jgi:hypothetical protein
MDVRIESERVTKTLYAAERCTVAVGDAVAFACAAGLSLLRSCLFLTAVALC